jgi:hypothetical protein
MQPCFDEYPITHALAKQKIKPQPGTVQPKSVNGKDDEVPGMPIEWANGAQNHLSGSSLKK